jgi:hypothetical protein
MRDHEHRLTRLSALQNTATVLTADLAQLCQVVTHLHQLAHTLKLAVREELAEATAEAKGEAEREEVGQ